MRCLLLACGLLAVESPTQDPPPKIGAKTPVQNQARHVNRLAKETSPYLLSHRHNPVDWYPWGEEALKKAKKENKPIFLSIGYAACHWCHVMERESFEDAAVAAEMNKYFVCIKVDREERPDLDEIYMAAVQRFTQGGGGWPMSVWLTPDLKPFYGGTYFPPKDAHQRPGFKRVCTALGEAWQTRRALIEKDAETMATLIRSNLTIDVLSGKLSMEFLKLSASQSLQRWDKDHGGFGNAPHYAPKFPHASELTALLINHARHDDQVSLRIAEQTLEKMWRGGIYDQVAGGFHRYSTDRQWLVPHFEKMLYDNALLAQAYLDAHQHTGKLPYRRVAREVLDYLIRDMQGANGGFHSTTDADSEGVEGKYFVWTKAEIDRLLGTEAELFRAVFGVTEQGNWHDMPGANVLSRVLTEAAAAERFQLTEAVVRQRLDAARKVLHAARGKRVPPLKDDKVITAWNGMAITAMARGYQVLGEPRYLQSAQRAAAFVLANLTQDNGRLFRTWRSDRARFEAYLEDYGFLADGLLHLFECDSDPRWLQAAKHLLGLIEKHFLDAGQGNFFNTADIHEQLLTRGKSINESSIPSGTAMAIRAFVRGGLLLADQRLVDIGRRALEACYDVLHRYPAWAVTMLTSCDLLLNNPKEVVIVGDPARPDTRAFLAELQRRWPRNHVTTVLHAGNRAALQALVPAHQGKSALGDKATAYVCEFGVCKAPVTAVDALQLK